MADELNEQIKVVEAKIAKVEGRIETVTERLEELSRERRAGLVVDNERLDREEAFLRAEVQRLGTKEHDLREEKKLLMAKQQPGADCRSWPATTLCARTVVACLLSCHAP